MDKYFIRGLQPIDKENWLTMWHEYMDFYQMSLPFKVVDKTLNTLLSEDKNMECLVACDAQNEAIGFLIFVIHLSTWTIEPECYVHDLYVKPEHRKAGVAKMLMNELKEWSKMRHWSRVYWLTKPDNRVAQILYNKIAQGEPWVVYTMLE